MEQQQTSKLVLDMLEPYFHTNRIVNIYRFYVSCINVMNLKWKGSFSRCTMKENIKNFPSYICFQNHEANIFGCGSLCFACELGYGMVAFSWCDGNTVNMLLTSDDSDIGSVSLRIGKYQHDFRAPEAVKNYNKNMDALDRWYHMFGLFSLHRQHKFKKYYRNIIMVIIDFSILQDDIHYHLDHTNQKNKGRVKCYETLSQELIITDWDKMIFFGQDLNESTNIP